MKIIINKFGSKLSLKEETVIISNKDGKETIPIDCISEIIVSNSCLLTSDVMYKCIMNNVKFSFVDKYGNPYIFMECLEDACSPIVKRKQLLLNKNVLGVNIVKNIIDKKLQNRQIHLNELAQNRMEKLKIQLKNDIENIQKYRDSIALLEATNIEDIRQMIQAYEGNAGRVYFTAISSLLKPKYKFKTRNYKPAKDFYNCLLNYSYGIMYNKIRQLCIEARLDPYIGIMHTDTYNKPTLTYDLIEPYRYYCKKIVFKLFSKSMINDTMIDIENDEYTLNSEGKKVLLSEYYKMLNKKVKVNKKNVTITNKIKSEILLLSETIRKANIC